VSTPEARGAAKSCLGAALISLAAAALQWAALPLVGARVPFMFFLVAISAAAFFLGRGPALIVLALGALNAAVLFPPAGSLTIASDADQIAILIYFVVALGLLHAAGHVRGIYERGRHDKALLARTQVELRQQLTDLEQLHDLSEHLPLVSSLPEQLNLILRTLVAVHDTRQGLLSIYDPPANELCVIGSMGFSRLALEQLKCVRGGEGACGIACLERRRVVVEDTEQDECFAPFRHVARHEGFRAVHSTPLLSHAGEILGAISVHFATPRSPTAREIRLADICARKAAVYIERSKAEALAQEREQRFQIVLDASAVPFSILSPVRDDSGSIVDFRWSYLNPAAAQVLNRNNDMLLGQRVSEILPGTWSETGLFESYVAVAERKEVREFDLNSSANGIAGWFHVVASPLQDSVAVWYADVTERKLREQELRSADRRKDEFLATLAHELRNPLAPIRQAALVAQKPTATDAQKKWCHEVIERQVQHMSLLLDDLLDVSRITRGVLQLRKQLTTLQAIVDSAVETTRPLLEAKRHSLKMDSLPYVPLNVDPLRISQVIANLLANAAKYTDPEGTIEITARTSGADLVLAVIDTGIGIAREELGSIFNMFSQIKSVHERSEGGLGIGLALTRGLVELHGGTIEASSAGLGAGSTFSLRLPAVVDKTQMGSVAAQSAAPKLVLSRRILLADDNQDSARSLATLLRMDGHEVTLAHDGEAAYERFLDFHPDVALLDIGMPRLSGYELAKRIRAQRQFDVVLLVAITGWGQPSDRSRADAAGFDHHLTKPVEYGTLARLLAPDTARSGISAAS
jgi:signal transduction histidine kinase/ActR/RegA family two-component response regulator